MDYRDTLYLPKTDFPMRPNPQTEADLLVYWKAIDLYTARRKERDREDQFTLHDGPPYANGHIHLGHALNKILKDITCRSAFMGNRDVDFRPGWDTHGLPIEWAVEREYIAKGRNKDDVPIDEFRADCRAFAQSWVDIQSAEFQKLGICADWENPYLTMAYEAEATIAKQLLTFAEKGLLHRGAKPVMWSYAEKTALAEAEIEYADITSDAVYVAYTRVSYIDSPRHELYSELLGAKFIVYTTTPWTLPASLALAYSPTIQYALYVVSEAPEGNWARKGEKYFLAEKLAHSVAKTLRVTLELVRGIDPSEFENLFASHPLRNPDHIFRSVPLIPGSHVTDDVGTGFVHTAPSHGREDYDVWMANKDSLGSRGIDTSIPYTVDEFGVLTEEASLRYAGLTVFDEQGRTGTATPKIIEDLITAETIVARTRLKHSYPHSWRSKKPVIFRNTPQWFIGLDVPFEGSTLRQKALAAIEQVDWNPEGSINRIRSMVQDRPDWLVSRQRIWGVPLPIFAKSDGTILFDEDVNSRVLYAFAMEGSDCWFKDGARERFLEDRAAEDWEMATDILDVWFDSGSSHTFAIPTSSDVDREIMYIEGSDQHRGWFQSSLLVACGTSGGAPYDSVLTHGFILSKDDTKMAKSLGNVLTPSAVVADYNTDILRLWVATSDYTDDVRIGKDVMTTFADTYRKIRNTFRWMLGTLAVGGEQSRTLEDLEPLEDYMLAALTKLIGDVYQRDYQDRDFKRVVARLTQFMNTELSSFYFDIRKDVLYCDAPSSPRRSSALRTIRYLFQCLARLVAPIMPFLAEEVWQSCYGKNTTSVHLEFFPAPQRAHMNADLIATWEKIKSVRASVLTALEKARSEKLIGAPLEASVRLRLNDRATYDAVMQVDFREICIVSKMHVILDESSEVDVSITRAPGTRCARSWRYTNDVGDDPDYPDVSVRDALALREGKPILG